MAKNGARESPIQPLPHEAASRCLSDAEARTELDRLRDQFWRYEFIVDASHDLISFVGPDYRYQVVNDAYVRTHGRHKGDMIGRTVFEIWGQEKFDAIIRPKFDLCFRGKTLRDRDWIDCGALGRRFLDMTYRPYVTPAGKVTGAVVTSHDLTDLRQAEDTLRASEENYRNLVDGSTDLIIRTNADGDYTFVNPAASLVFAPGKNFSIYVVKEDLERSRAAWERIVEGEPVINFENRVRGRDGEIRYLAWSGKPILAADGSIAGCAGIARDITASKRAEIVIEGSRLTPREAQIFRLLIQGFSNLNIASHMDIAEATVKFHLNAIFRKTKTRSRTELAALVH